MRTGLLILGAVLACGQSFSAAAQDATALVRTAVQTEITASRDDHSRWLYFDVDRKPGNTVRQWVAETVSGDLHRVLAEKGHRLTPAAQRSAMDDFIHDSSAQAKQRKSGQHDDRQSADMLSLLPSAFDWAIVSRHGDLVRLHFTPNPQFEPPTWTARVFAAMEGDMEVETAHHRIASLRGRLVHDVRFCGGICGDLSAGGTFDVERRATGPTVWQIVETHVHIHGTALFFKDISQDEDDQKTDFQPLPGNITLAQAESELLKQNGDQTSVARAGK
ncbi:MAG TPA: hypothetical protein VL967_15380 [Terracidiphilus sp.]|nr:hypothetical protein [Terracidiphilus sp.]